MRRLVVAGLAFAISCSAGEALKNEDPAVVETGGTGRQLIGGTQQIRVGVQVIKLTCPAGKSAISGGYRGVSSVLEMTESFPGDAVDDPASWYFTINNKSVATQMALYAICALP